MAEHAPLETRLQRMDMRLADIQAGIAEIRTIYEAHHERLERIEKTLYGNGSTGLCTKVAAILWLSSSIAAFAAVLLGHAFSAWLK